MVTWGALAIAAPDLAAKGRELLYRTGHGEALLVTVHGDDPLRVHPRLGGRGQTRPRVPRAG